MRPMFSFLTWMVVAISAAAQGTRADYERAAGLEAAWRGKLREFAPAIRWLPDGKGVAWKSEQGDGWTVVEVGGEGPRAVRDLKRWGLDDGPVVLAPRSKWDRSPAGRVRTSITFENRLDRRVRIFWVDVGGRSKGYGHVDPGATKTISTFVGHVWLGDFTANDLTGVFVAEMNDGTARFTKESRRLALGEEKTPGRFTMKIVDHDVVGIDSRGREFAMTTDGTEAWRYGRARAWSPDGKKAVVLRVRPGERRRIPLVEAAPGTAPKYRSLTIGPSCAPRRNGITTVAVSDARNIPMIQSESAPLVRVQDSVPVFVSVLTDSKPTYDSAEGTSTSSTCRARSRSTRRIERSIRTSKSVPDQLRTRASCRMSTRRASAAVTS